MAHKTCETALKTYKGRRLNAAVHLAGLRCDGSAHGGCQADCNLFWKDVWLKPAEGRPAPAAPRPTEDPNGLGPGCTESQLLAGTVVASATEGEEGKLEPSYSCQATRLYGATEPLPAWDLRQYFFDVATRNRSGPRVIRGLWLASLRELVRRTPFGYRLLRSFTEGMYQLVAGRSLPEVNGRIKRGCATPTGRLHLRPGELVRIKSLEEIEATLNEGGTIAA